MALREDYKDALFDGSRRYQIVQNDDGTYTILDTTSYTQEGDRFGANDINATNAAVNEHTAATDNPHKVTAEQVGAAASNHSHTAADIGAAEKSHKHAAGDITSGTLPVARGGTGLTASPSALTNLASTSAANVLQASPRPGVTGILPVANGGTGCNSLTAGLVLIGNGTGQVAGRAITDNTSNAVPSGTNLATCNTVDKGILARLNRTSSVHAANTAYTGYMARGIALVTSAPSSITNGCCAFVYE